MIKMGYIKDVIEMFKMNDGAYVKVGNDKKAFWRYFWIDIGTSYAMLTFFLIILSFFLMIFVYAMLQQQHGSFGMYLLIAFLVFLILPFVIFFNRFIGTLLAYFIGYVFGGKARYTDFFKVWHYPHAVFGKLMAMFGFSFVYGVLSYFFLYKTYTNIMGLKKTDAIWACVILGIIGALFGILLIIGYLIIRIKYFPFVKPN